MKTRIRPLLIAAALLGAAMPAWAQYKVGIVNIDRIIREAPAAVAAQKKLQQEFAPRERELATLTERGRWKLYACVAEPCDASLSSP